MKKKYFNLFIVTLIGMFIYSPKIIAEEKITDSSVNTQQGTTIVGNCTGNKCKDSSWFGTHYVGIRLTLVDSDGNRIKNTISTDYFSAYTYSNGNLSTPNGTTWNSSADTVYTYNINKSAKWIGDKYMYNTDVNNNSRKEVITSIKNGVFEMNYKSGSFPTLDFLPFLSIQGKKWESEITQNYFEEYFKTMSEKNPNSFNTILNTMAQGSYANLVTQNDICQKLKDGYFIIEPIAAVTLGNNKYVGTITELSYWINKSEDWNATLGNAIVSGGAKSMWVSKTIAKYQPITPPTKETFISASDILQNGSQGYAMGVYKLTNFDIPLPCSKTTCYNMDYKCDSTACENTKENNNRTCSTNVTSKDCQPSEVDNNYHASGKKTIELIPDTCSLYCTETATVSYPGNVSPGITLGMNLEWPTKNGLYQLKSTSTLSCKVEMNDKSKVTPACLNAAAKLNNSKNTYINSSGAKLKYDAPKFVNNKYEKTITYPDILLDQYCDSTATVVNQYDVTITNDCYYTLPEGKDAAIDKKTLDFIDVVKDNIKAEVANGNWILMGNGGVIPIDGYNWDNSDALSSVLFSNKYQLQILDMPLGYEGQFTKELNKTDYICNYRVTTDINGCNCPPGTDNEGINLIDLMGNEIQTCAEAIEKYCNIPIEEYCPSDSDMPGHDYKNDPGYIDCSKDQTDLSVLDKCKSITCNGCPSDSYKPGYEYTIDPIYQSCRLGGNDKSTCLEKVCNDICITNCDYVCPKGTDNEGMDITSCVGKKDYDTCVEELCDNIGIGNRIIYRTISLENPFPSIDANIKADIGGPTIGMFNTTVSGRYPGTNWNGITVVKNKILKNRNYVGSAIYQEAEPLYVIELDAASIREIRDYNELQIENDDGYSDFTLTCTDGAYCISDFLHNKFAKVVTGGTCKDATVKERFVNCYETK